MPVGLAGAAETVKIERKGIGIHGWRRNQMNEDQANFSLLTP
jgi:hypothetical protein